MDDETFKNALAHASDKLLAHLVYADYLDEAGRHDEALAHRLKGKWPGMIQTVRTAVIHGTLRDEWAAWETFADELAAHGDTPVTGFRTALGDHTRTASQLADAVRENVALEKVYTAEAAGRRGTGLIYTTSHPGFGVATGKHAGTYDRPGESA